MCEGGRGRKEGGREGGSGLVGRIAPVTAALRPLISWL